VSRCTIFLNVVLMTRRGIRPERAEVDAAALELLTRHGSQIYATARRYAATPEDAEDACQRGIETLLTKAPSTSEDELIPWLKTVVKHEAFALRRQRERHSPVTDDGELRERPSIGTVTHEQAERLERLRQGAEALGHLKPHEIKALVLKAEGFSYREICAMTGWSYTKVNRLLTEGRRAFLRRLSGIERGADCARYEPLLSALADGEASPEDLAVLRPHMKTCLSCRAALREFRAAPGRVASVVPVAAVAGGQHGGSVRGFVESVIGAAQHKTAAMGDRLHAAAELATGQKVAAIAASAAALAGGGTAIDEFANHDRAARAAQVAHETPVDPPGETPADPSVPTPAPPSDIPATPPPADPAPPPAPAPAPAPPPPPPNPANEFDPTGAPAPTRAPAPTQSPATTNSSPPADGPSWEAAAGGGGGASGGGGSGGEFGP
jgi:RNA polymerase sigma factor (sigma-70 family)